MNDSELKRFLLKYIKPTLTEDFVFSNNILHKKTETGFLKGFCFEKSGNNKEGFYLWCFVQPLYVPSEDLILTFGERIKNKKDEFWQIDKGNENAIKEIFADLNKKIKGEGISYLEETGKPEKFCAFFNKQKKNNIRIWEAIVYTKLYNELSKAEEETDMFIAELGKQNNTINWIRNIKFNLELLLSKDLTGRKRLMKEWECETLRNLKLI
jgi:hypothetical protein